MEKKTEFDFMLASNAKREVLVDMWKSRDWGAQEKFDGRRFAFIDGEFISRHTSVKTDEKVVRTGNVPHLVKAVKSILGVDAKGLILDGEIVHSKGFGSCGSAMGSGVENSLEWQEKNGWVKYVIFDMLDRDNPTNAVYKRRHEILSGTFKNKSEHIIVPELVVDVEEKKGLFEKIVKRGGEGVILKKLDSPYEFKRSKHWVKVKKVDTYDVVIMGYEEANEWYAEPGEKGADGVLYKEGRKTKYFEKGWIGAVIYGLWNKEKGKLVEVGKCSGLSDEERKLISDNRKKYIGTVIEIKANERMPTGGFRHPNFVRFRDDKSAKQCLEWQ
jgi:bifunctional non-homologous end joining protein LigD